jgi:hypothetical protein
MLSPVRLGQLVNIQALVILADVFVDGKYIAQHLPVFDPRLVVVNINWELERGSKHFWDCSEVFLRQKRSGEIKGWALRSNEKNVLILLHRVVLLFGVEHTPLMSGLNGI